MDDEKLMSMLIKQFNQIENQFATLINDLMTKIDAVYKEVLDMRQEQAMHTGAHQRVDETLDEHDRRIKKLESPTSIAHSVKK